MIPPLLLPQFDSADTQVAIKSKIQIITTQSKRKAGDINLPLSDTHVPYVNYFPKSQDVTSSKINKTNIFDVVKSLTAEINKNRLYRIYPEANNISLNTALKTLPILKKLNLVPLNPQRTSEGGIILEFPKKFDLTFIEFGNDDHNCFGVLNESNEEIFIDFVLENLEDLLQDHLFETA